MANEVTPTGEATAVEPSSFGSIAASVIADSSENPTPEAGEAVVDGPAAGAEGEPAAEAGADADGEAEGAEGAEGDGEPQTDDQIVDAFANLKREDVPEDLLPMYDQIAEARKKQQADYTRKTMALADDKRTVAEQVQAQVDARLAELGIQQATQDPATADQSGAPDVWAGLGEEITADMFMAEDASPQLIIDSIDQRATAAARREGLAVVAYIESRLEGLAGFVTSQQTQAADTALDNFISSNPELAEIENGIGTAIKLLENGTAVDLDDAAAKATLLLKGNDKIIEAQNLGIQLGSARKATVDANREAFSVPSGATTPKTPDTTALKGKGFSEIADLVATGQYVESE